LGIGLIFVGILIIVVAAILLSVAGAKKGKVKGGGVVMIGPIPIIFGTDKKSLETVLVLSLALTVVLGCHDCVLFVAEVKVEHGECWGRIS
jgi:uncharacterized protein (TIGR00304 family)